MFFFSLLNNYGIIYSLGCNLRSVRFYQIYTGGCKTNVGTATAALSGDVVKSLWITGHASIFTAELVPVALNLALDIIRRSRRRKMLFFSDSSSVLVVTYWLKQTSALMMPTSNTSSNKTPFLARQYRLRVNTSLWHCYLSAEKHG